MSSENKKRKRKKRDLSSAGKIERQLLTAMKAGSAEVAAAAIVTLIFAGIGLVANLAAFTNITESLEAYGPLLLLSVGIGVLVVAVIGVFLIGTRLYEERRAKEQIAVERMLETEIRFFEVVDADVSALLAEELAR